MYAIVAVRQHTDEQGWVHTESLPTFYLDENVQGILNEQDAEKVAMRIIGGDRDDMKHVDMMVTATRVNGWRGAYVGH